MDSKKYQQIVLNRLQFYVNHRLPVELARNVKADAYLDMNSDHLVMTLRASVFGETVPLTDVTFPVSWIDAVKDRWLPKWVHRWFPINYRRVTVDKHTLFPSIEVPGHEARIAITNRDFRWWDNGRGNDT